MYILSILYIYIYIRLIALRFKPDIDHSGKMFLIPYRYGFFWVGRLHKNGMIVILLGISSYLLQQKRIHRGGWELSHIPAETRLVGPMFSRSQEGSQLVQVREEYPARFS